MTYLIVGNGPAGVAAIERIRQLDALGKIILVSRENNQPYNRIMLPEHMIAEVAEKDLYYKGLDFYEQYKVETLLGRKAEKLIPEKKQVVLDNGAEINYDQLLIATGSSPIIPSWVDLKIKGVFILWDKTHSHEIHNYLNQTKEAVIIGGGLVGLHSARALHTRGIKVTLIEKRDRLMPLQLDETASSMLLKEIEGKGIRVLLGTEVKLLKTKSGRIHKVCTDNEEISTDLVLISVGVKPNLQMTDGTSLEKDSGLITDSHMQTSINDIYAAGDVAQAPCAATGENVIRALWPCAVQQGKVAGANVAGLKEKYTGSTQMNSIQLFGLSVLSLGQIDAKEGIDEKILKNKNTGEYQKLFFKEGKLVGLIFVGDIQQAGILYHKLGHALYQGYWSGIQAVSEDYIYV